MSSQRLWIVAVLLSLLIVTLPMGIALTLLPLAVFAIPMNALVDA